MHSLWGKLFNLIKETSLTWRQLFWGIAWVNVGLMIADAPKYKKGGTDKEEGKELESEDDFNEFLSKWTN